ncbi:metal ABC transporter solute-binding protein, Zn/Mn family [Phytohalomonas tamaricis]|uniref:metal ABC transporter solute-binding protein, Zn/Mn family n=1 Tax=Phytohalomonas tamaricis TaxID=2081032 RepID=UPI000D0BA6B7|nr:zinc ABC transporter substrate-binding protein [Phytohalomonas tamaricis]
MRARLLLASLLLAASPGVFAAPLKVAVSIVPEQWLITQLGGDDVDVMTLVKPGLEPEEYSPTPKQLSALTETSIYFAIGVPFEAAWLDRMASQAPQLNIVDLHEDLPLRSIEAHHHDGDHDHDHDHEHGHEGAADPHVWLDPQLMVQMAHKAADALVEQLPERAADIRAREAEVVKTLNDKTREIASQLKPYEGQSFMVYHPAWGYYADRFHLTQLPIELNGREPTPRSLSELIEQAREHNIHVIFVQEQFSQAAARRLAQSLDAEVTTIDPLAADYIENLQRITDTLVAGFEKSQRDKS